MLRFAALAVAAALAPLTFAQNLVASDPDTNGLLASGAGLRITEDNAIAGFGIEPAFGIEHGMWWDAAGTHPLAPLAGDDAAIAWQLGAGSVAVGTSTDFVDAGHLTFIYDHAVLWSAGVPTALQSLVTGGANLQLLGAASINTAGEIVGTGRDPSGSSPFLRGYLFRQGHLTDLGGLVPGGGCTPVRIDDAGTVMGSSQAPTTFQHAFVWQNGTMVDKHDFSQIPGRNSRIDDGDRFGRFCGAADFVADFIDWETAALWNADGTVTNLGTLGGIVAEAYGMNDFGVVVGGSVLANGENRAFLWRNGVMHDLNDLVQPASGWILLTAQDVNDNGWVVGQGLRNGALRAFVAVPDCSGGFQVYGAGCAGSGGLVPAFGGVGCPTPGSTFALTVADGLPNSVGVLLLGTGTASVPVIPTCALQIAPLVPAVVPVGLDARGGAFLPATIPLGTPALAVHLQAFFADPGGNGGLAATHPLQLLVQ